MLSISFNVTIVIVILFCKYQTSILVQYVFPYTDLFTVILYSGSKYKDSCIKNQYDVANSDLEYDFNWKFASRNFQFVIW